MRVNEATRGECRRTSEARGSGQFGDTLREARRARGAGQVVAGGAASGAPRTLATARTASAAKDGALRERREVFHDGARLALADRPSQPPTPSADALAAAELRAAVRAVPPMIDAARLGAGAPLALAFGRALSVELRPGAAGVELLLRADATLLRAAAAELPALVTALRARGVGVARAEVRPQAPGTPPASARPPDRSGRAR
jgi:hypothetical protein